MHNRHYYCVIMAGGAGKRFWPVSRVSKPKQFLNFSQSGKSFLRLAYERAAAFTAPENILVVTLSRYQKDVIADIPELPERNLLLEPYNRNTANCIAYAAYTLMMRDSSAVMAVLPSDQVIDDAELFCSNLTGALDYASAHPSLITLGIVPTRPDPNFGYIQVDGEIVPDSPIEVKTFTEKPDRELAQVFIETGEFLWNSGIFIWKARDIISAIEKYAPEITTLWSGWRNALGSEDERSFVERVYPDLPRTSIDYAVMEKASDVITYPSTFGWADIGNWESFYEYLSSQESDSNAVRVRGHALLKDDSGDIVYSSSKDKLIAVCGLREYIVIDSGDVLLVCPRDEEKLKALLSELSLPDFEAYR